tara:strand:+ start:135524 stop:135823 length:300 start_codon:yes stop_codon:yes gene_type:complete
MSLPAIFGISLALITVAALCLGLGYVVNISLREITCRQRTGYPSLGAIVRAYRSVCFDIDVYYGDYGDKRFIKMRSERKRLSDLIDQEEDRLRRTRKAA